MCFRDQTSPSTPERVRSAAQRNERDQRILESPEYHRPPHNVRINVSAPVFMPQPVAPPPVPIYSNFPPHLAQQYEALQNLYPRRDTSVAPLLAPAFVPAPAPAPAPAPPTRFSHLPPDLAQRVAALNDPYPRRDVSVTPQLAPAFVPVPAPAPAPAHYSHLPANLAQQVAALPPMPQHGRGSLRGRPRGRGNNTIVPAPAPLPYAQLAAQYTALPPLYPQHAPSSPSPPPPAPLQYPELAAQYAALPPVCFLIYFIDF